VVTRISVRHDLSEDRTIELIQSEKRPSQIGERRTAAA
jgi:hypothetical protein